MKYFYKGIVMLDFFGSYIRLRSIFKWPRHQEELRRWAEVEYKKDANWAYNHMMEYGIPPRRN